MNSSIENIVQSNVDASKNLVIALSGGVDSSVLAHILCKITRNIRLVFVQHNQVPVSYTHLTLPTSNGV